MEEYYKILKVLEGIPKTYERDIIIAEAIIHMEAELSNRTPENIELKRGA